MPSRRQLTELEDAERAAWDDYLDKTKTKDGQSYQELEPWAWAKLRQTLREIRRRRKRLAV